MDSGFTIQGLRFWV